MNVYENFVIFFMEIFSMNENCYFKWNSCFFYCIRLLPLSKEFLNINDSRHNAVWGNLQFKNIKMAKNVKINFTSFRFIGKAEKYANFSLQKRPRNNSVKKRGMYTGALLF